MQHHLPTHCKRFVRRNSTFILLNLLIASLCWSAYTNGYIDNVNELLMSDKMRRRLKNAQHINGKKNKRDYYDEEILTKPEKS